MELGDCIYHIIIIVMMITLLTGRGNKKYIIFFWIGLLTILVGVSHTDIGNDHHSYAVRYYNEYTPMIDNLLPNKSPMEFAAYFIMSFMKTIGMNGYWWVFFMALLQWLLIYKVIMRLFPSYISWSLIIYFAFFFLQLHFNIIRHGVCLSFIWLAFSYIPQKNLKKYLLYMFIGYLFHKVALVFIPMYWIVYRKSSFKLSIVVLVASFAFGEAIKTSLLTAGFFVDDISRYTDEYLNNSEISTELSVGTLVYTIIFLLSFLTSALREDKTFNFLRNLLLISIIMQFIFRGASVFSGRIANIYNFSLCLFLPYFFTLKPNWLRIILKLFVILYCIVILHANVINKRIDGTYQFIPYKTILTE